MVLVATRTTPTAVQNLMKTQVVAQDAQIFLTCRDRNTAITAATAAATYYAKAHTDASVAVAATTAASNTAATVKNQSGISALNANIASILLGSSALGALSEFDESSVAGVTP